MKVVVEGYVKKTSKKVMIETECGRAFTVNVHEIADNRASYYSKVDEDVTYEEEYDFTANDSYEPTDWLFNNMNWNECKTLKEIPQEPKDMSELEIKDYHIFTPEKEEK